MEAWEAQNGPDGEETNDQLHHSEQRESQGQVKKQIERHKSRECDRLEGGFHNYTIQTVQQQIKSTLKYSE